MKLREGEHILKTFKHHPMPFAWQVLKALVLMIPFYLIVSIFSTDLSVGWAVIVHIVTISFFSLILLYMTLIYWMDKLVVTNQRVVYKNYKYLTISEEAETFLDDIQDITTKENGILSYFWIFDYGLITIETPASDVTIVFEDAPDPEGIRQLIFHTRKQ